MASVVIAGDTSGSVSVTVPATAGSNTITLPAVTGTAVISGQNSAITASTAVASTSGTSIDFTSIPSWVKRITVMFSGVSTNGSSTILVRLGTSSGFVTTGYASSGSYQGAGQGGTSSTAGLIAVHGMSAVNIVQGIFTISNLSSNTWVSSFAGGFSNDNYTLVASGSIGLSAALTQIRITTANGTDTFDAGTINILYE